MKTFIALLVLICSQFALAAGLEMQINTLKTVSGETYSWEDITNLKATVTSSGKVEIAWVMLKSGKVISKNEISSVVMTGNTPVEDVSTRRRINYSTTVSEVARASGNGTSGGTCP